MKRAFFDLKLTKGTETLNENMKISVGFSSVSNESIESVGGDNSIEVAPSAPVITTKQFGAST